MNQSDSVTRWFWPILPCVPVLKFDLYEAGKEICQRAGWTEAPLVQLNKISGCQGTYVKASNTSIYSRFQKERKKKKHTIFYFFFSY